MPSEGIRRSRNLNASNRSPQSSKRDISCKTKPQNKPLSSAGLVAQVRSAYTRSHPELGRETLQRP